MIMFRRARPNRIIALLAICAVATGSALVAPLTAFAGLGHVRGRIVDQSGTPISGASWGLYDRTTDWYAEDMPTGPGGVFEFTGTGHYTVSATSPGYFLTYYKDKATFETADSFTVADDELKDIGDIVLRKKAPTRVAAGDRYSAAIAAAKAARGGSWGECPDVILVCGESRAAADGLTAAGLSWAYNQAPILFTGSTSVPKVVQAAITEIRASNPVVSLHVVGGEAIVPSSVLVRDIKNLKPAAGYGGSITYDRVSGANRYATAAKVRDAMEKIRPQPVVDPSPLFLVNGADPLKFYDALSVSALAAHAGTPILLVRKDAAPVETLESVRRRGGAAVYVVGGTESVAASVPKLLRIPDRRIAGANRYATAARVAEFGVSNGMLSPFNIGIASSVPDALMGGASVGTMGGPLLLTSPTSLPQETRNFFRSKVGQVGMCYVYGGSESVSPSVYAAIAAESRLQ